MMTTSADYVDLVTPLLNRNVQAELKDNISQSALDVATEAKNKALISALTTM